MSSTWTVPSYGEGWTAPGYTDEQVIGRGASGRVVRAIDDATGRRVAIKYLGPALVGDPAFMWAFRAEAQMLRGLGVPQVVEVYDYLEQPGEGAAVVMELVNGVSLHELIERGGPTEPEAAVAVLKSSLLGLAAAHTLGIIHRDYKPENVLIDAAGNSKLVDFGVAVRWGKHAPAAGTPLYLAPEQWNGAPASPASDIYAATLVSYECLTGSAPFSGKLSELRQLHLAAAVPLERVDPALHGLIARGMAKDPQERPQSAIAFVSELEALAASAYGPYWEERGRRQLAARTAALLPLVLSENRPAASGRSYASTWEGGRRRTGLITISAVAAVLVLAAGAVAATMTLKGNNQTKVSADSAAAVVNGHSLSAVARVTPQTASSTCAKPATFAYSATVTAYVPLQMKYQWVYSSGASGPVQTASFTAPGEQVLTGATVSASKTGSGWGELKMVSPSSQVLDKATYQLSCGANNGQIVANSWIPVPPAPGTCGEAPAFTVAGDIWDSKAGTVTYHWKLSDGTVTAPETLTFKKAESTLNVNPLTISLPDGGSGSAVLIVTKPVKYTAAPAAYRQSCTAAGQAPEPTTAPAPGSTTAAPTTTKSAATATATAPKTTAAPTTTPPTATTAPTTTPPTPTTTAPTPTASSAPAA